MTGKAMADRYARWMLDTGFPVEAVIAEFLRGATLDRIKSISRIRLSDTPGDRLVDPGDDDFGRLWLRAEIVAAVMTALDYGHVEPGELRQEIDRSLEIAMAPRQ